MPKTIYTIGHSTHEINEFIDILKQFKVNQLVDIRTLPGSKHNPQFNAEDLKPSLARVGIDYIYLKKLGGLRPKSSNSVNQGWHNLSFRNYADYMQTEDFNQALAKLIKLANKQTSAIMCAEAVPWRCHRSLVADALLVRKFKVENIISKTNASPAKLTSFAKVKDQQVTYPSDKPS